MGGWVGTNKLRRKQSPKPGQPISANRRGWEEGGNPKTRCYSHLEGLQNSSLPGVWGGI